MDGISKARGINERLVQKRQYLWVKCTCWVIQKRDEMKGMAALTKVSTIRQNTMLKTYPIATLAVSPIRARFCIFCRLKSSAGTMTRDLFARGSS